MFRNIWAVTLATPFIFVRLSVASVCRARCCVCLPVGLLVTFMRKHDPVEAVAISQLDCRRMAFIRVWTLEVWHRSEEDQYYHRIFECELLGDYGVFRGGVVLLVGPDYWRRR